MAAADIDDYLDRLDEPKRSTLSQLRQDILAVIPDAEQCISYAVPAFKVGGRTIAGNWPDTRGPPEPCAFPSISPCRPGWSRT